MPPKPTIRYPAGRMLRLRTRREVRRVFREGLRVGDGGLLLIGCRSNTQDVRGAVIVSRKHGPAVRRNRIKRLCREALRLNRPEMPAGWDLLLLPRPGVEQDLTTLRNALRELGGRLAHKVRRRESHDDA